MASAAPIAEWIVRHSADDLGAPVDPMSLEKLIYYAQSFSLALFDEPLFSEEIRAWRHGPVVRSVYDRYAEFEARPITLPIGDLPKLDERIEAHLAAVIGFFGQHNALTLSSATHAEGPWQDARKGFKTTDKSDVTISQKLLRSYYSALFYDGEEALSRLELLSVVREPRWSSFYIAGICAQAMVTHPFYDVALAKKLAEPISEAPKLGSDFYAPIKPGEMVEFPEDSDIEAVIRKAGLINKQG